MPIYNVLATIETTMVVVADDEDHAWEVAQDHAMEAFDDADEPHQTYVTGEVKSVSQLRGGWNGACIPYGGDRNTRLRELLSDSKTEVK
jgi:hypothetical protein